MLTLLKVEAWPATPLVIRKGWKLSLLSQKKLLHSLSLQDYMQMTVVAQARVSKLVFHRKCKALEPSLDYRNQPKRRALLLEEARVS